MASPRPPVETVSHRRPLWHQMLSRVRSATTTSLAIVGVGAVGYLAYEYQQVRKVQQHFSAAPSSTESTTSGGSGDSKEQTKISKKVLVLPFHRMRIVETRIRPFMTEWWSAEGDEMMEVELSEIVNVIHSAASDPSIVALYGIFGHGFGFSAGGWAHVEEIRNALKVWKEAHRVHPEPNLRHETRVLVKRNAQKPSYAYADSFADPDDRGNKEYLLASAFSHVHMQQQGELNLFGVAAAYPFLRSFMEMYGIKAHVFKHGKFKNAPNMFTEKGFTKEHRLNVQNLVDHIDGNKRDNIVADRNTKGFDQVVWKMIRKHGTFTGPETLKLGLVDHLPKLDPLDGLLESNKNKESKDSMKNKWGNQTDLEKFEATERISFIKYRSLLSQKKKMEKRKAHTYQRLKKMAESSSAMEATLNAAGFRAPYFNYTPDEFSSANLSGEKVAVVHVQGQINNQTARKTVASLRKIKNDCNIKAVVLRVDSPGGSVTASETILQECKDLPQPVVCSMANTCASGGYYIATACDRIFALPTTVTGSIGVFGIKFDLTGLAKKYGISVQHITTGPYSASYHPFQPLNQLVKNNLSQNVDRYYDYFKSIVAESRGLDMKEVELLAQGRVWTGIEAKGNGLVDELGGLERAIAYARRNFTQGDAEVERWPKRESILERFRKASDMVDDDGVFAKLGAMYNVLRAEMDGSTQEPEISEYDAARLLVQTIMDDPKSLETIQLGGVALTIDESSALAHILTENTSKIKMPLLHPSIWS